MELARENSNRRLFITEPVLPRHRAKVWIVLPAYNEAENLGKLLQRVNDSMAAEGRDYQVIVVNDGSADGTAKVAEYYASMMPVHLIHHPKNLGLGATMRDGLKYATTYCSPSDVIVAMDADNTHSPGLIRSLLACVEEGNDVVIASRFQPGAHVRGVPALRRWLSVAASWLFRISFPVRGVKDYTCGYRAYRGDLMKTAFLNYGNRFVEENGFECMVDILLKLRALNALFREVPLVLRYDMKEGASKMNVGRTIQKSLGVVLKRRFGPKQKFQSFDGKAPSWSA